MIVGFLAEGQTEPRKLARRQGRRPPALPGRPASSTCPSSVCMAWGTRLARESALLLVSAHHWRWSRRRYSS